MIRLSAPAALRGGLALAAVLTGVAAADAARSAPAQEACGSTGVSVQVLGSGGPELQDRRASSSYLIWRNGVARVLVDIGGGAALRFGESGATMADLSVLLLTHLHVDHTADLTALVKSSFFEERKDTLPLYGPAGNAGFPATQEFVDALFAKPKGAYRYLGQFVDRRAHGPYLLEAHTLQLGAHELRLAYDGQGIKVVAAKVVHGDVPALAYRVEIDGVSIAFSGDGNGDNGNLERLARGSQLLVAHNPVPEGATGVERRLHMPPSVIGRVAHDAGVGGLVLSHRMLRTLGREAETEAHVKELYQGPVTFANDLDCFPVRAAVP